MQHIEVIQSGLDYIEDNLKSDITAEELSDIAGFSLFHYYRLFDNAVGMPVMQYIVRRRLLWAAYEIGAGRKVIDVALEYGFDTAAGFYKAFRREFGCSPSEYAKRFKACKPHQIILLHEEHIYKVLAAQIPDVGHDKERTPQKTDRYIHQRSVLVR